MYSLYSKMGIFPLKISLQVIHVHRIIVMWLQDSKFLHVCSSNPRHNLWWIPYIIIYIDYLSSFTSMFTCLCDMIYNKNILYCTHIWSRASSAVYGTFVNAKTDLLKGNKKLKHRLRRSPGLPVPMLKLPETFAGVKNRCAGTRDYTKWDLVTLGDIGCLLDSSEHVLEPIIQDLPEDVHG